MIRRWAVRPDEILHLNDGREILVVSDAARQQALIEADVVQNRCGGYLGTSTKRVATDIPGEMVTVFLVVTWQDRTDAKEQPETPSTVHRGEVVEVRESEQALVVDEPDEPEAGFKYEPEAATDDNPDGFDHDKLEAEDIEEPEPVR